MTDHRVTKGMAMSPGTRTVFFPALLLLACAREPPPRPAGKVVEAPAATATRPPRGASLSSG